MADPAQIWQSTYEAERRRLEKSDQAANDRLERQKAMLDLIKSGTPLAPEDAEAFANLENLDVPQLTNFFSRAHEKYDSQFFNQIVNRYSQIQTQREVRDRMFAMDDQRAMYRDWLSDEKRKAQTPDEEDRLQLYQDAGVAPGPSGMTYQEINADIRARKPKTATPRQPTALDQPTDINTLRIFAEREGVEVPPEWEENPPSLREAQMWMGASPPKPTTPPKQKDPLEEANRRQTFIKTKSDDLAFENFGYSLTGLSDDEARKKLEKQGLSSADVVRRVMRAARFMSENLDADPAAVNDFLTPAGKGKWRSNALPTGAAPPAPQAPAPVAAPAAPAAPAQQTGLSLEEAVVRAVADGKGDAVAIKARLRELGHPYNARARDLVKQALGAKTTPPATRKPPVKRERS